MKQHNLLMMKGVRMEIEKNHANIEEMQIQYYTKAKYSKQKSPK